MMAEACNKVSEVPFKTKVNEILEFCKLSGYAVELSVLDTLINLSDKFSSYIDGIWKIVQIIGIKNGTVDIADVITILKSVSGLAGFFVPKVALVSCLITVVVVVVRIILKHIAIEELFKTKLPPNDEIFHEIAGLVNSFKVTQSLIDSVCKTKQKNYDIRKESIFNTVLNLGVRELGSLRSRIQSLMVPKEDDLNKCLQLLILYVKITTFRQLLFSRCKDVFEGEEDEHVLYSFQKCLDMETSENKDFLKFFSSPSIESAIVLTVFDPNEKNVQELVEYLSVIGLPFKGVTKNLKDVVFKMQPFGNSSVFFGRPFFSFRYIRTMNAVASAKSDRIKFRFVLLDDEDSFLYIKLIGKDAYLYMDENGYCRYMYSKATPVLDNAQWRVIRVHNTEDKDNAPYRYMFCTKQWPDRILHVEESFFECAKGKLDATNVSLDCLFTLK